MSDNRKLPNTSLEDAKQRVKSWEDATVTDVVTDDDEIVIKLDNEQNIHLAEDEWCLGRTMTL